jgi:peptide/nickel transport system substrate-binding protein
MATISNATGANASPTAVDLGVVLINDPAASSRFVNGVIGQPQTLDPAWDFEGAGTEVIQNVYETLVTFDGANVIDLIPRLVIEVPTIANGGVSADGLNYTFHLRTGITFHDGTIMDANDVIYSIKRCLMINDIEGPAYMLGQLLYPDYLGLGTLLDEATVDASMTMIDSSTVVFHLVAPSPSSHTPISSFLYIMATTSASVVSKEYVEMNGGLVPLTRNEWMNTHECGSGPYALENWEPYLGIALRSFPDYWRPPAAIEEIVLLIVSDEATRTMMLASGDASSVYATWGAKADFEGMPGVRVFEDNLTMSVNFFGFNQDIVPGGLSPGDVTSSFFADLHVRQAFVHAFDFATYLYDVWQAGVIQPNGPIPYNMFGHDYSIPNYTFDLSLVESQLDLAMNPSASGQSYWDTGFTLNLYYNAGNLVKQAGFELLKTGLEGSNSQIHINVIALDWPTYLNAMWGGQLPMAYNGWGVDYPDPDDFAYPFCHESGMFPTLFRWSNGTLTDLVNQAARELNSTVRQGLYSQIQQSCFDNAYYLWSDQQKALHVEREWVQGYYFNPTLTGLYYYDLGLDVTVPSAPIWSSLTGMSDHIELSWGESAVAGSAPASSYLLYRGTSVDELSFLAVAGMGYNDFDVSVGQTYYYAVRAFTSVGDGELSDVQSASLEVLTPGPPTIGAATPNGLSVTVEWTAPASEGASPITNYSVFFGTSPFPSSSYMEAAAGATSVTFAHLAPNTLYYFNVVAINAQGAGPASDDVSATTTDIVPNAPTIGTATAHYNNATVTWTAPSANGGTSLTGYRVYFGTSTHPNSDFLTVWPANSSALVEGLNVGTSYFFNVVAVNAAGISSASADASAETLQTNPPSAMEALTGDGVIALNWSAPADAADHPVLSYRLVRIETLEDATTTITVGGSVTSYVDRNLTLGKSYKYELVAVTSVGDSLSINSMVVQVRLESRISLEVYTIASTDAFHATQAVNLTTSNGSPIAEVGVQFAYSRDGISWSTPTIAGLSPSGSINLTWYPTELNGTYFLRVEYLGNQTISSSSRTVSMSLESVSDRYMMSVCSASTVSNFAYNASKNELTFALSGETGTTGHARIVVPSGLVGDLSKLTLKVDGLAKDFQVSQVTGGWAIDIAYNHSAHQITVNLGELPSEGGLDSAMIIAFGMVAAVIVVILVLIVLRKRKG